MTRRDLHWRLSGVALFAAAAALGMISTVGTLDARPGLSIALGLVAFLLYMTGAVLVIQGERLPLAWRNMRAAERRPSMGRRGTGLRLSPTRRRDKRHARHHHPH